MTKLYIKQKGTLPEIFFDNETGKLEIKGQSSPTNADLFYKPAIDWLDDYVKFPHESTEFVFFVCYFNTMSAKNILHLMKKMEELNHAGKQVKVFWKYLSGDDDLHEAGTDFESIVDVPFELIEVED